MKRRARELERNKWRRKESSKKERVNNIKKIIIKKKKIFIYRKNRKNNLSELGNSREEKEIRERKRGEEK